MMMIMMMVMIITIIIIQMSVALVEKPCKPIQTETCILRNRGPKAALF